MAAHHLPAPIPTPLPEPQPETYFSETQWQVLLALIDATVPSIVAEAEVTDRKGQLWISQSRYAEAYEQTKRSMKYPPNYEKFQQYLGSRLIDSPRFIGLLRRFVQGIPNSSRKQLGAVLNVIA